MKAKEARKGNFGELGNETIASDAVNCNSSDERSFVRIHFCRVA
jgi:hypothetical protein